jgi:hypothetical protein
VVPDPSPYSSFNDAFHPVRENVGGPPLRLIVFFFGRPLQVVIHSLNLLSATIRVAGNPDTDPRTLVIFTLHFWPFTSFLAPLLLTHRLLQVY